MKFLLFPVFLILTASQAYSQDTLRTMFYNVLNYPDPVPAGKADTLAKILAYEPVDLLMVCELKTEAGADSILNIALNGNIGNSFARANFVPQISNPGSSWKLQQLVFYDSLKLSLHHQSEIETPTRDINRYTFFYLDSNLAQIQDTAFLDVYVTHLKSSQGSNNETLRRQAAANFSFHLGQTAPDRQMLFAGDLNVYRSTEPAYQQLLSDTNNTILIDPIDEPGNWHNSSSFSDIHTQSTRTSSLFGDGAGGGMDDRFDFILVSENMTQPGYRIKALPSTYDALGNDGSCYNQRIIDCNSPNIPDSILNSLYYMSDHLPVRLDLEIGPPAPVGIVKSSLRTQEAIKMAVNASGDQLFLHWSSPVDLKGNLVVNDITGSNLLTRNLIPLHSGQGRWQLPFQPASAGVYFLTFYPEGNRSPVTVKFIYPGNR